MTDKERTDLRVLKFFRGISIVVIIGVIVMMIFDLITGNWWNLLFYPPALFFIQRAYKKMGKQIALLSSSRH